MARAMKRRATGDVEMAAADGSAEEEEAAARFVEMHASKAWNKSCGGQVARKAGTIRIVVQALRTPFALNTMPMTLATSDLAVMSAEDRTTMGSMKTLLDPYKNSFRVPLINVCASLSQLDAKMIYPVTLEYEVFLTSRIYDIKTDFDIWQIFHAMIPVAGVRPCPPLPFHASALVRGAPVDPSAMASRIPRRALRDPSYWFTVPGMMRMVENPGYRAMDQPAGLTVELKPYQQQTLAWMWDHEHMADGLNACFWERREWGDKAGSAFYYCPLVGEVSMNAPPHVTGGFICEEMGMGKTLEVLSLILANPRPAEAVGTAHATLVVVPLSLLDQWRHEIATRTTLPASRYHVFHGSRDDMWTLNPDVFGLAPAVDPHPCTCRPLGEYTEDDLTPVTGSHTTEGERKSTRVRKPRFDIPVAPHAHKERASVVLCQVRRHNTFTTTMTTTLWTSSTMAEEFVPRAELSGSFIKYATVPAGTQFDAINAISLPDGTIWMEMRHAPDVESKVQLSHGCWLQARTNGHDRVVRVPPPDAPMQPINVTPDVLGGLDIVLTTYETLSTEHVLARVPWWRVVLDESQRIRSGASMLVATAAKLPRVHSWLVSGTPAGNAIDDLLGQLVFLRIEPWCRLGPNAHNFWRDVVVRGMQQRETDALEMVHTLLAHIMMRHSKSQMIHGRPILELPPRRVVTLRIEPTDPSEAYAYAALEAEARVEAAMAERTFSAARLPQTLQRLLAAASHARTIDLEQLERARVHSRFASSERTAAEQLSTAVPGLTFAAAMARIEASKVGSQAFDMARVIRGLGLEREAEAALLDSLVGQVRGVRASTAQDFLDHLPPVAAGATRSEAALLALAHLREDSAPHHNSNCTPCANFLLCTICQDVALRPAVTACMHIFCLRCIETYLHAASNATMSRDLRAPCPLCKTQVVMGRVVEITKPEASGKGAAGKRPKGKADTMGEVEIPELPSAARLAQLWFRDSELRETYPCPEEGIVPLNPLRFRRTQPFLGTYELRVATQKRTTRVRLDGIPLAPEDFTVPEGSEQVHLKARLLPSITPTSELLVIRGEPMYAMGTRSRMAVECPSLDARTLAHIDAAAGAVGAKVQRIAEEMVAQRAADAGTKFVVFAAHQESLQVLQDHLATVAISALLVTGSTPGRDRSRIFAMFRDDPSQHALLLSTQANAAGLTLTAANVLFLMDACLEPSVEAQLMNRVHRIGQTRPVTVFRLVLADSVEERILTWRSRFHAARHAAARNVGDGGGSGAAAAAAAAGHVEDDGEDEEDAVAEADGGDGGDVPLVSSSAAWASIAHMRPADFAELFGAPAHE